MASRLYRYTHRLTPFTTTLIGIVVLLTGGISNAHVDTDIVQFPLSNPDLVWQPEPFEPVFDTNARYIDYSSGSDTNPGTRKRPWKHHPWDSNATANAEKANNISTYYFKKGVTYYGSLVARESGTSSKPIQLTVNPDWGDGNATISGSTPIKSHWHKCGHPENKVLPENSRQLTWCNDTALKSAPSGLWVSSSDEKTVETTLARTPNWTRSSANDPREGWHKLESSSLEVSISVRSTEGFQEGDSVYPVGSTDATGTVSRLAEDIIIVKMTADKYKKYLAAKSISNGHKKTPINRSVKSEPVTHLLTDTNHLITEKSVSFKNATLWIEPRRLPIPVTTVIRDHRNDRGEVTARFSMGTKTAPVSGSRYYLEGLPQFLDRPGEFSHIKTQSGAIRIYLRLPDDIDPNTVSVEANNLNILIHIKNKKNIAISGLHFRSNNQIQPGTKNALTAAMYSSAIQISGTSSHISIHHNYFEKLTTGVIAYPENNRPRNIIDNISITDNTFMHIDGTAIALGNGQRRKIFAKHNSRLISVDILRNKLHDVGLHSLGQRGIIGIGGDAILVSGGEIVEIAHNHVDYSGGPGIHLVLGAEYSRGKISRPFLRGLIHHNKVINTLLSSYDFGGISAWTGGPVYIYNNISGNPVGYRPNAHHTDPRLNTIQRTSFGLGIYLDGVYKGYVFNNIIWGLSNDLSQPIYNAGAFNEAIGFMHSVFHNTLYKFAVGLHRGGGIQHNRNYYMGNLLIDMSHKFIQHESDRKSTEFDSIAYKNNIFQGNPTSFGQIGRAKKKLLNLSLDDWRSYLKDNDALASETGTTTKHKVINDAKNHDFHLASGSPAIGKGLKIFVPMSLSRVVGEWNFYQNNKHPTKVSGENINMNAEWVERPMFHQIPRNDLTCPNTRHDDYVAGLLENWVKGAIRFNGKNQYCKLSHDSLTDGYRWKQKTYKKNLSGTVDSSARDTVDIKTDSFIIETVVKVQNMKGSGSIVNKYKKRGYELSLTDNGHLNISLDFGNTSLTRSSDLPINDGKWHHLLVEFDRSKSPHLNIYTDGTLTNGELTGKLHAGDNLSNKGDFIVGHSEKAGYLTGQIDFLRISKGTLNDAHTTIDELKKWQFNGPYLRDFSGLNTSGIRSNAGAVESVKK